MIARSLRRTLNSKTGYKESRVPKNYTLNEGHVYFFITKAFICIKDTMPSSKRCRIGDLNQIWVENFLKIFLEIMGYTMIGTLKKVIIGL